MTVSWVELPEQEDHLSAFIAGMKKGDFVAAMAGPLYLEESNKEIEEALGVGETSIITLVGGYLTSELSQVLSAALHDVAQQPGRYADLYQKYLGVRREAPDLPTPSRFIPASEATSGSNLHRVLQSGELRLGFWRHEPYFYSKDGQDCGFELELVEAIGESLRKHYPGLQIRWVECPFESDGRGLENLLLYEALEPTLLKGEVDALLTGIIRMPDRPVAVAAPTIAFFWTVLYTGKDGWDLSSWQGGERQQLIDHLVSHPGCIVMSTPGGPSQETAERLVRDTLDAGGSASSVVATVPEMIQAAFSQSVHFITGDAVALANLAMHPDFQGLNMNISARLYEMLWLSPVTALDP
jgi:hypothetical protein